MPTISFLWLPKPPSDNQGLFGSTKCSAPKQDPSQIVVGLRAGSFLENLLNPVGFARRR